MTDERNLILFRDLPNPQVPKLKTFKFVKTNYLGVFEKSEPFIYFDEFVSKDLVHQAQMEVHSQENYLKENSKLLSVNGIVPKEINNGIRSIDSLLMHLEKHLNPQQLAEFSKLPYLSQLKEYINTAIGQKKYWDLFVHLRKYS